MLLLYSHFKEKLIQTDQVNFCLSHLITTGVPGVPTSPTVTDVTGNSMTLSWSPPSSDGGSPITGYIIEKQEPFSTRWTQVDKFTGTSGTIGGLREGNEYQFRVIAINKAGNGKPSSASKPTVAKPPYGEKSQKSLEANIPVHCSQRLLKSPSTYEVGPFKKYIFLGIAL